MIDPDAKFIPLLKASEIPLSFSQIHLRYTGCGELFNHAEISLLLDPSTI